MTWTALTFTYGQKLTSTQMNQLFDNLTALANGDSGAPEIQAAAFADGCVGEDQLATDAVATAKIQDQAVNITRLNCSALLPLPPHMKGLSGGGTGSGWIDVNSADTATDSPWRDSSWYVYLPSGTKTIRVSMYGGATDGAYRVLVNSTTGNQIDSVNSTQWYGESYLDCTSITGWTTISVQKHEDFAYSDIRWRWASS